MTALVEASGIALAGRLEPTEVSFAAGELACLVGPNGSGKTSLLHALAGIGQPCGKLRIEGIDPWRAPPAQRRRLVSYLPASRDVKWPLTASDVIALGGGNPASTSSLLSRLGIADMAERRVDRMSTGERSRVLIARALAPRARLLLLDEPVANLDPLWQLRLMEQLRADTRSAGQVMLVAMHDLDLAARCADRLIVMRNGKIVADGDPAGLIVGPVIESVFGIRRIAGSWRIAAPDGQD